MPHGAHTITIAADGEIDYHIEVNGSVSRVLAADTDDPRNFAESADTISEIDTGHTIRGNTGAVPPNTGFYGDTFEVGGPVTGFSVYNNPGNASVRTYLDGEQMPPSEIVSAWIGQRNVLEIVSDGSVEYDFTANGNIRRYQTSWPVVALSTNDSVSNGSINTASGSTGGGKGDAYAIDGDVMQFSAVGSRTLRWNGNEVTEEQVIGGYTPDPCAGVECGEGEECVDGDCVTVDPCAGVSCGEGEECVDGTCVPIDDGENGNGNGNGDEQPEGDDGFPTAEVGIVAMALIAGAAAGKDRRDN